MNLIDKKKIKILIIEDEKILADALEERLAYEGFSVFKAFDGASGLSLALEKHPDLILLDILLPKVDGLTMFKKLKEDSWGKHANVIILTNVDNSSKVAEAMAINKDDIFEYVLKTSLSLDGVSSRVNKRLNLD